MTDKLSDIPNFETFSKIEAIDKGWSSDKKYYVETFDGSKMLLRISAIADLDEKKQEFEIIQRFSSLGINMSLPIAFGVCNNGHSVYQLLTWCEGEEAKEALPSLSKQQQFELGCDAGNILKKMKPLEYYAPSADWANSYGKKVEKYISAYKNCGRDLYGIEVLLSFLEGNFKWLDNRERCLLHGDFQTDNMIISPEQELYIIDFQGSGLVDPYYALTGATVSAEGSLEFSVGQLKTYFDGNIPDEFWKLNAFYTAAESIHAFTVAVTLGQEEVDYSNELMKNILEWHDNFNTFIPNWFIE